MQKYIRNFSIIAHIDHGKSTLSDRIIEICTGKKIKKKNERILDNMEIEKEKGITIKSQSVRLIYNYKNKKYIINLIDTPGHTDFSYEVSRCLSCCEGALLLIDASKGIQSQTIANFNIAKKFNIKIIIIINKIDLININIKKIKKQIKKKLNINKKNIILCSAKKNIGINKIIKKIIKIIPYPKGKNKNNLQAIIIDSYFDNYKGIFFLIKIYNGNVKLNDKIKIININKTYTIKKIYICIPKKKEINNLYCGEVGWISCNIKKIKYFHPIGKTIISHNDNKTKKLNKFKKINPQIYASIYPKENKNFIKLKKSIKKLSLNDSSLTYSKENSNILGSGFRCGFLGTLHIEIIKERLEREYNIKIIITSPTVIYKILTKKNKNIYIKNYNILINKNEIKKILEPISICNIFTPNKYLGKIIKLCINKRGIQKKILYLKKNIYIKYEIPTSEIINDFSYKIKSISNGYASFEYNFLKYKKSNIKFLDIYINQKKIEGLSKLLHINNIKEYSNNVLNTIKNNIKKQQFAIKIQIACNNKIIKKINLKYFKKNVISKCYGGDITRKKKLIEKQKKGKKKMKKMGKIIISKKILYKIFKLK